MAVARMKKITVLALASLQQPVLDQLQRLGAVQLANVRSRCEELRPVEADTGDLDERLARARFCLRYLERHQKRNKGLLESFIGSKYSVDRADMVAAAAGLDLDALYAICAAAERRLEAIRAEQARVQSEKELLAAWQQLEVRLEELSGTEHCRILAGTLPSRELGRARALATTAALHLEEVGDDGRTAHVLVLTLRGDAAAEAAVRELGLGPVSLQQFSGRARELVAAAEARLDELRADERRLVEEATGLGHEAERLRLCIDHFNGQRQARQAASELGATAATVMLTGWCLARRADEIERALGEISPAIVFVHEDPAPGDVVPVQLENQALIEPFEVVTNIYGFPSYNEIDPTPLLAPFFFVFFGLALTDAGYGIVLTLLAFYALRKLDIPRPGTKLIRLLAYGGISTVIFGALTGGWFGDLFDFLPLAALRTFRDSLVLFNPIEQPLLMLVVSLALGITQVWFGISIKAYDAFRRGAVGEAIWEHAAWVFFIPALLFMALTGSGPLAPVGKQLALLGALWVVVGNARKQRCWLLKPFTGLYGLYNIIGYFSDTLSYARLLALGLATGVIASVVNQIAGLGRAIPVVGVLVAAGIIVGGHTFNLLINVLGSFIHSGRLQFVEFFTKFFEGGGRAFRPFRSETEFVHIRE